MTLTERTYIDPETQREHAISEPARPDLLPGQTVTYEPDRYCLACEQARGTSRCPICGGATLTKAEAAAASRVPVHFDRPMGVSPPADDDALEGELEPLELEQGGAPALELLERGDGDELAADELAADEPPRGVRFVERPPVDQRPQRGRVQPEGMVDNARGRAQSAQNTRPVPQRYESPLPLRRRRIVERAELGARNTRGAAAMERSNATTVRRPQRVQEIDQDTGHELHRTGASRRGRSIEDQYALLWEEGKIDKAKWAQWAGAALGTPDYDAEGRPFARTAAEACALADEMYCELISREKK